MKADDGQRLLMTAKERFSRNLAISIYIFPHPCLKVTMRASDG